MRRERCHSAKYVFERLLNTDRKQENVKLNNQFSPDKRYVFEPTTVRHKKTIYFSKSITVIITRNYYNNTENGDSLFNGQQNNRNTKREREREREKKMDDRSLVGA